jgi:hypothetical protein
VEVAEDNLVTGGTRYFGKKVGPLEGWPRNGNDPDSRANERGMGVRCLFTESLERLTLITSIDEIRKLA